MDKTIFLIPSVCRRELGLDHNLQYIGHVIYLMGPDIVYYVN